MPLTATPSTLISPTPKNQVGCSQRFSHSAASTRINTQQINSITTWLKTSNASPTLQPLFTGVARAGLLEALVWGLTDAELINAAHRGEKKRQELLDGDKQKRAALLNQIKGMSVEQVEALMSSLKADQSKEAS
jgi:cell division FtsZ-interacting protein ZapD